MYLNALVQLISDFSLSNEDFQIMRLEIDFLRHVYILIQVKRDNTWVHAPQEQKQQQHLRKVVAVEECKWGRTTA